MNEEHCPICECPPDSGLDISNQSQCELCGIGISEISSSTPSFKDDGQHVHFCCERCQSIYIREIASKKNCMDALGKDDPQGLEIYDELVREMVIDYLARKYPKGCHDNERNGGEKND